MRQLSLPSEGIKIHVRTPKSKKTIEMQPDAKVSDFKEGVSTAFGVAVSRLCLLYEGKILKDNYTLNSLGITSDKLVHLSIQKKVSVSTSARQAYPAADLQTAEPSAEPSSGQRQPAEAKPGRQFNSIKSFLQLF